MNKFQQTIAVPQTKILLTKVVNPSDKSSNSQNLTLNIQTLTDQNLYSLCKTYGSRALEWRRKFTGLLPEVNRRRLYEKKGFPSIFVFAYKLAGLSEEQVRLALNLEKRFEKLPKLKSLLINGEVSTNKLVRVASIANSENQEFLANQIQTLSQGAVETLVRDEKLARIEQGECENLSIDNKNQNGLLEPQIEAKSLRTQTSTQSNFAQSSAQKFQTLNLSPEVHQKLLELQQKGLDINQILLEFLQKRELEIAQKKEQISEKVLQKEKEKKIAKFEEINDHVLEKPDFLKARPSLPVATQKILYEKFGTKCAIKSCKKGAENIHHTLPFSVGRSNDPKISRTTMQRTPRTRARHKFKISGIKTTMDG